MTEKLIGKVQTVTGLVEPGNLGLTTTHEHLLIDFSCMFNEPAEASERYRAHEPVTINNLGWVSYQSFANLDTTLANRVIKFHQTGINNYFMHTTPT